jgi:cyclic beta-1,2-glucan synthetase
MELFHMLNPINHTRQAEGLDRYQAEPYVVPADVYAHPMHVGRAGWTWYTGSAGWMYRAAIENLLGLQQRGSTFSLTPSIPAVWPAYTLEWTRGRTKYRIVVSNPENRSGGIGLATLDGAPVDPQAIPLKDDGQLHTVEVVLGKVASVDRVAPV